MSFESPSSVRTIDVPSEELWGAAGGSPRATSSTSIGGSEILVGSWDSIGQRPGPFYIYDIHDDSWTATEPSPMPGQRRATFVPHGTDVIGWGLACDMFTDEDLENEPVSCASGYSVRLVRFSSRDRVWSEVTTLPAPALPVSDPSQFVLDDLGIFEDDLYFLIYDSEGTNKALLSVDLRTGESAVVDPSLPTGLFPRCIDGNGVAIGPIYDLDEPPVDSGTEDPVPTGESPVAARQVSKSGWEVLPGVTTTLQETITCDSTGFSIIGPVAPYADEARWRTYAPDGHLVADTPLPAENGAWVDMDAVVVIGGEMDATALVSSVNQLGADRRIVVLPGVDLAPLTYRADGNGTLLAAGPARLPGGEIFMFASRMGGELAPSERTRILLAE